ncbi:hypothetical protein [Niveibacterium sp.]|uniref:hypothetical protein n=1 Tax=Niveibacterium sp. TaxID=2017444 RepID=UPI0035ADF42C
MDKAKRLVAQPGARYALFSEDTNNSFDEQPVAERNGEDLHVRHAGQTLLILERFFLLPAFDAAVLEMHFDFFARLHSDGLATYEWSANVDAQWAWRRCRAAL